MLRVLLAKDLRRAWRNPLPWLINLIVPLAMTALIGMVFGGKSDSGALGRIRFAVVDEDKSVLSDVLRGSANQREGGKYLEPVFLEREDALRQLNASKLSAVLIIPEHFMRDYLTAREAVSLELIKNPAESIHPAVLEELLGAVVTALNAISRNFNSEFPEWQEVFEGKEDYHKVSMLIERAGEKLKTAKKLIDPPLVTYEKEDSGGTPQGEEASAGKANGGDSNHAAGKTAGGKSGKSKQDDSTNVFAYLLLGLAAMFLLFLGNNAMTDLHRELRKGTFERYQTMHQRLGPFIVGKVVFAVVVLLLCSAIMLGGGGLIFRVHWQHPVPLISLAFGYAVFVAGLFAVLVALVPDERRSAVLTNVAGMALGLVGGCAFPPQQLPAFLRDHLTPLMPSNWFVETARNLQFSSENVLWTLVLLKLAVTGVVLIAMAAFLFRRRFKAGLRA
ncbi:MAG TPA: ABC transporter permease [Candidatus Acidoferrum sp.]|jgi:ABC-type multidrug transport system permease subunit|nr:ABC transporter permease [Candidatus Acidoferrum sp.]